MKYLKKYKLFESENKPGHKYTWDEILERLTYLTDLGFSIDDESKKQYFRDDEGDLCNITLAHWLVTEINLTRNYFDEDDVVSKRLDDGRHRYFCKWDDRIIEFQQEIAAVCAHFDVCYHNVTMNAEGWQVSFIIWTEVEQSTRDSEREKELIEKTERKISSSFEGIRIDIALSFSSASRGKIGQNKLGENMWSYQGSFEEGFLIMALNFETAQPAQFKRAFQPKLETGLDTLERFIKGYGKVELRKITEDDLKKLADLTPATRKVGLDYFSERYLGLMGYIIQFDYNKMFNEVKETIR